jgi:predicted short-subunit dehydrogenase-like oxidoreductase (DUF2520 family)
MNIVIIGTGNVATILGKRFCTAGHNIMQVYGRSKDSALQLLQYTNASFIDKLTNLQLDADVYLIAVADNAIGRIVDSLPQLNGLLLHTAGSVSKDVLRSKALNYGILYPIQSIRKEMSDNTPIPFAVEGNNQVALLKTSKLAESISENIVEYTDDQRLKLHVAAVLACNFVNYLYLQSARFCEQEGLKFDVLQPLIEETAIRLRNNHPINAFTGPAKRKDLVTIDKHLQMLQGHPLAKRMYELFTESILKEV